MSATLICPNCRQPVDPAKPNAMLSAATQQWQHTDCWTAPPKPRDSAGDQPSWKGER